jgi:hypothetical protein
MDSDVSKVSVTESTQAKTINFSAVLAKICNTFIKRVIPKPLQW